MATILVIEDQRQMLENLVDLLELEKFKVFSARDGSQGIALARQHRPDLILCDVMMPELDGYGVLRALRADKTTSTVPFIFLTAKSDAADLRTGMNLGADDYLTKPVTRRDLLAAIAARLKQRQVQDDRVGGVAGCFRLDFSNAAPLESLGLTQREAEVLLWVAQGKTSAVVASILGISTATVKRHLLHTFAKLGVETRNAATLLALEVLNSSSPGK
jgi:DNA-binding NarL/FixJ family response regulator